MWPHKDSKIFVAGHQGMVGAALSRALVQKGYHNIVTATKQQLDLRRQKEVEEFFRESQIDMVFLSAAKVGGILANNQYPADFIYDNMMIEFNVIHSAHLSEIDDLLYLGSSCIYPRLANQPISETELLNGKLEPTNEPYAIAKIAGLKLCESYNRQYGHSYRSVMPTNLYGPGDDFVTDNSHVIPALIRNLHKAKIENLKAVSVWGTGSPYREFLHVDDLAEACIYLMQLEKQKLDSVVSTSLSHINVGSGEEIQIRQVVELLAEIINYRGVIDFDHSKPDGTPRKLLNSSIISSLGWRPQFTLRAGLESTYEWYLKHHSRIEV
ncbi:MAG: GDP-L-fucose synthase [Arenimonas sp.]